MEIIWKYQAFLLLLSFSFTSIFFNPIEVHPHSAYLRKMKVWSKKTVSSCWNLLKRAMVASWPSSIERWAPLNSCGWRMIIYGANTWYGQLIRRRNNSSCGKISVNGLSGILVQLSSVSLLRSDKFSWYEHWISAKFSSDIWTQVCSLISGLVYVHQQTSSNVH